MRRGTTPTHTITTDISLVEAPIIFLTYKQLGHTILEFDRSRLTVAEDHISVELLQSDTLKFNVKPEVEVQIRAKFQDGTAVASNIMLTTAERILKDGVI